MWAQTWGNIYDLAEPFSGKSSVDATPNMINQVGTFSVSNSIFSMYFLAVKKGSQTYPEVVRVVLDFQVSKE